MAQAETLRVPGDDAGARLDRFLARALSVKVEHARALIEQGHVRIRGKTCSPHRKLFGGEDVVVLRAAPRPGAAAAVEPALPVLHDDADCLIVDKPAGLAVEPSRPGAPSAVGAASRLGGFDVEGRAWPGLPHRLDRDTSGCLALARHDRALAALRAAFEAGLVEKTYLALVKGAPPEEGHLDTPYGRDPEDPAPLHRALPEPAPGPALVPVARAALGGRVTGGAAGDRTAPTRSASSSPRRGSRSWGTPCTGCRAQGWPARGCTR